MKGKGELNYKALAVVQVEREWVESAGGLLVEGSLVTATEKRPTDSAG